MRPSVSVIVEVLSHNVILIVFNVGVYIKDVERDSKYTIRTHSIFAHNFLIFQWIFNPKKGFGKLRLRTFQPYHPILCMSKYVKGQKITFDTFNIHSIGLNGWKTLSFSFPKLFLDWKLVEY